MTQAWDQQRERSNTFMLRLLIGIAHVLGRSVARVLLLPITAYFLLTGGAAKRASRHYLRRVLQREPTLGDLARHFHAFASTSLDRFFFLSGSHSQFEVAVHRPQAVYDLSVQHRGCLLLLAHVGSFEVLRTIAVDQRSLPLRMLIDLQTNHRFISVVKELHPDFAARVIDASQPGPALVLSLKEALEQRAMVGMMADRVRDNERSVQVDFLGGTVRLPAGPWILAATLGVPVIVAFGLYRGGNRYDVHFELFADKIALPRAQREQALQHCVQAFATQLEARVQSAPYNWFNFYDFWADETPAH
jgi:predicted LPLAT superfamily acyltransferase